MIHEIRETIQQSGSSDTTVLQFQKRINLKEGMRHTINHIDFFDDGIDGSIRPEQDTGYQVYISNYPIVMTNEEFVLDSGMDSGPLAGDDLVLFKASMLSFTYGTNPPIFIRQEFPNQFLGSMPTFSFYTPQLYFTVIYTDTGAVGIKSPSMSIYMAVDSVECNSVEYGIGMLQEYSENQAMLQRMQGIAITQSDIIGAMPMWQIGGIRPEFMASNATNTLGENWFFSTAGYGGSETMSATSGVRQGLSNARTMTGFGDAFGKDSAGKAIPDWFKAIAKPFPGLESGPVRSQEPPLKHADNGNVRML